MSEKEMTQPIYFYLLYLLNYLYLFINEFFQWKSIVKCIYNYSRQVFSESQYVHKNEKYLKAQNSSNELMMKILFSLTLPTDYTVIFKGLMDVKWVGSSPKYNLSKALGKIKLCGKTSTHFVISLQNIHKTIEVYKLNWM